MNPAQKALLVRLREIVEETPKSGALNAGNRPLHVSGFARALEGRAEDGSALVKYARAKVYQAPMASYTALIKAGRPDLTVEGVVADADAEWATEFTDEDRAAARDRHTCLGLPLRPVLRRRGDAHARGQRRPTGRRG